MSFNCMNINSSFLKMLEFGKSGDALSGFSDSSKEGVLFKEQFASMFQKSDLHALDSKSGNSMFDKFISFMSKEIKGLQGMGFLKKLKEFFMMISGEGLTKLTIGEQGLDALKELLAGAGFESDQVNELIDDLKLVLTQENRNISIDELMNKFSELDWEATNLDEIQDQNESILPISAIPFIESIMISLGIPEDVRNSILSDVKTDQGIDLNVLIKNLKEVEEKTFVSGTYYRTGLNDDGFVKFMQQLKLGNGSKSLLNGKLSLQDFINILENKRNEILTVGNKKGQNVGDIFAETAKIEGKETLLANPIKSIKSKADHTNSLITADSTTTGVNTNEEKKISELVDRLFKSINKKDVNNDKIVNVPLNKYNNKDFEKLFPFSVKVENGKEVQITIKSELEEKFSKFIGKLESNMNGRNDSENRNFFHRGKHQAGAVKMPDSSQSTNGEGKLLNSVRYLSSAKKVATRTLPSYVTNQIGRSIVRAVNQGQTEIKIQLKPPELGRMMITIQDMGDGMKVSVIAENQTARDILLSNSNSLKAALASSGINLENFDVDMGSDFNRSMADAKNQAGYSKNNKGQKNHGIDDGNMDIDDQALIRKKYLTHDGVLYYVA